MRAHGKRRRFTTRRRRRGAGPRRAERRRFLPRRRRPCRGRTASSSGFRYYGTRPDDPNDVVPHEHRRELRAIQVFGAWTNLVDMKAGNTLDTLVTENGRAIVKHYLQDVGSTFGTGALVPRDGDEGHEYLSRADPWPSAWCRSGLYIRDWQTVDYEEHPQIGRFEGRRVRAGDVAPARAGRGAAARARRRQRCGRRCGSWRSARSRSERPSRRAVTRILRQRSC